MLEIQTYLPQSQKVYELPSKALWISRERFWWNSVQQSTLIYAYADTEMKREAIRKADVVRNGKEIPVEIWADDDEMILILSGLK